MPASSRSRAAKPDPKARIVALTDLFTALSHPARRQILLTVQLRGGSMTAGEIAGRFACAWPTTTRHLRVLVKARLLRAAKVGRTRVYRIDVARLETILGWIAWFHPDRAN